MKTAAPVADYPTPEPEQKQAVVVSLYANEKIPVFARLDEFPAPPSFSWCLVFAWRMSWAFALVSLVFAIPTFILLLVAGVIR